MNWLFCALQGSLCVCITFPHFFFWGGGGGKKLENAHVIIRWGHLNAHVGEGGVKNGGKYAHVINGWP